jgi:hypothetical protein
MKMTMGDAFAEIDAKYRLQMQVETFGHLAPKKNKTYKGRIVYAIGCFGDDRLNPTAIYCEFEGLSSSPWFFDAMQEFLSSNDCKEGYVYEFVGTLRNYTFEGKIKTLLNANKEKKNEKGD